MKTGFTLLEVVLALTLSVLVMVALGIAIQVNLRATSVGRQDVQQAQLARAILRRMADDVRASIWYEPPDLSGLMSSASSARSGGASGGGSNAGGDGGSTSGANGGQSGGGQRGGGQSGGGQSGGGQSGGGQSGGGQSGGGQTGGGQSGGGGQGASGGGQSGGGSGGSSSGNSGAGSNLGGGSSSSSSGSTASEEPENAPGLFGGRDWIEFDVSRLPRVDEYRPMATSGAAPKRPSDVRTVAYYLATSVRGRDEEAPATSGLVRREADRAATLWAATNGASASLAQSAESMAPEVVAIEFSYFDGSQWLTEWDSNELKALPVAVQISIELANPTLAATTQSVATRTENQGALFHVLVHIPASKPAKAAADSSTGGSQEQTGQGSNTQSGGGAGGSASQQQ